MKQKIFFGIFLLTLAAIISLTPSLAFAHQPQIVTGDNVVIDNPEISKAFYDILDGHPRVYLIEEDAPFDLYINLLVPLNSNPDGRFDANVFDTVTKQKLDSLSADSVLWKPFYEDFANDWYVKGPELDQKLPAGSYSIIVSNASNHGKYVLAVGKTEQFTFSDTINSLRIIPTLKNGFFGTGAFTFAYSIIGASYLFLILIMGFILGLLTKMILGKLDDRKDFPKICLLGRILRAVLFFMIAWIAVLLWMPWLNLLAGLLLYVTATGWCILCVFIDKEPKPCGKQPGKSGKPHKKRR